MPTRTFAITAASEMVTLDDQGRGEISFTASNTGPKSMPGRAKLVPLGSTKEDWLSLDGEPERKFAKGEAHQFTVKIAAPRGTPTGKYPFRLNIISVENPDDEFTEGPSVSFEVKHLAPAAPPPRKFPWWIVAVAGVVVLGAGIITWLLVPPKTTPLPKVVGQPINKAIELLKNFTYKEGGERITGQFPAGVVVEQNPQEGANVLPGATVALVVEAQSVQVPQLIGLSIGQVGPILEKASLRLTTAAKSNGAKPGTVLDQNPKAGDRVAPATMITAFVEPEPEMVTVPDVIGVPLEKVAPILQGKFQYQVNAQRVITGNVPIGAIANQSPAASQRVPPGTNLALTVEADSVQVPNLKGKRVDAAFDELRHLRLVPSYRDGDLAGKIAFALAIAWQSPQPGVRVAPGTTVTVNAVP
jgi:beta-lactam-binding protein with PASTA domain